MTIEDAFPEEFLVLDYKSVRELVEALTALKESYAVLYRNCEKAMEQLGVLQANDTGKDLHAKVRHARNRSIFELMRHNIRMIDGMQLVTKDALEYFISESMMETDAEGNNMVPLPIFE